MERYYSKSSTRLDTCPLSTKFILSSSMCCICICISFTMNDCMVLGLRTKGSHTIPLSSLSLLALGSLPSIYLHLALFDRWLFTHPPYVLSSVVHVDIWALYPRLYSAIFHAKTGVWCNLTTNQSATVVRVWISCALCLPSVADGADEDESINRGSLNAALWMRDYS